MNFKTLPRKYQMAAVLASITIFVLGSSFIGSEVAHWKQEDRANNKQVNTQIFSDAGAIDYQLGVKSKNEIWVFSDPACIHCKRLHKMLNETNENVTVHILMLPSAGSIKQVDQILCSAKPETQWDKSMREVALDAAPPCGKNTDHFKYLAKTIGVESTPVIINASGYLLEGVPSADFLRHFIKP